MDQTNSQRTAQRGPREELARIARNGARFARIPTAFLPDEEWLRRAIWDGSLPESFNSERAARVIHATLNGLLRRRLMNLDEKNLPHAEVGAIVRALVR